MRQILILILFTTILPLKSFAEALRFEDVDAYFEENILNVCNDSDACRKGAKSGAVIYSILTADNETLKNYKIRIRNQSILYTRKYKSCEGITKAYYRDYKRPLSDLIAMAIAAELKCEE